MIIGHFVADPDGNRFQGELGFPFPAALVLIEPTVKIKEGGPDCLVLTHSEAGHPYDIGAAWHRTSRDGKPYLSVKLDSPLLTEPVNCALFGQPGGPYRLVWSRDDRKPD